MHDSIFQKIVELQAARQPFALATVVAVRGSSSASVGSKAVIDKNGRNVMGWIGGGCAESYVIDEALRSLSEMQSRVVEVDMDDEVLGVGMPCGGYMDVFIEPMLPQPLLVLDGDSALGEQLARLAPMIGFSVQCRTPDAVATELIAGDVVLVNRDQAEQQPITWSDLNADVHFGVLPDCDSSTDAAGQAVDVLVELLARIRGASGKLLAGTDGDSVAGSSALPSVGAPSLLLVGHNRITEAIAAIGHFLGWSIVVNGSQADCGCYPGSVALVTDDLDFHLEGMTPQTYVVIATQHKGDHLAVQTVLRRGAGWVGLIASRKRARLVLEFLFEKGYRGEDVAAIHGPAGIDIHAATPEEIGLSVIAEIAALHSGRGVVNFESFHKVGDIAD